MGRIPFHQTRLSYSRTWDAEPLPTKTGDRVVIKNRIGRVELLPADNQALLVKARIQAPDSGPARQQAETIQPIVKRDGGQIVVEVPDVGGINLSYSDRFMVTDLQILVPAGVDVQVDSGTGRVTAENTDINLTVNGSTGTVELKNVGGNIHVVNNTGRLLIDNPGGDVRAQTNTGSIEMSAARPLQGVYELKSNTGRVQFNLPRDSNLVLNAKSGTGRVTVLGLPANRNKTGPENEYSYKLWSGKGRANLRVGTGTINIRIH